MALASFYQACNSCVALLYVSGVAGKVGLDCLCEVVTSSDSFVFKIADQVFVSYKVSLVYLDSELIVVTELVIIAISEFNVLLLLVVI